MILIGYFYISTQAYLLAVYSISFRALFEVRSVGDTISYEICTYGICTLWEWCYDSYDQSAIGLRDLKLGILTCKMKAAQ
ncbi:hypothetical protein APICC_04799 [Apis cerana cerana]|uniref:Uncharacterized protein n=1 Tax=Apis cerana cerana TaxID=94128 RepID=A0A2A3E3R8_APICC|nr:hypothetical protein APICC_04799 [Apis cerana cerana]